MNRLSHLIKKLFLFQILKCDALQLLFVLFVCLFIQQFPLFFDKKDESIRK